MVLNKINSCSLAALRCQVRTKVNELVNIGLVINSGHPALSSVHPSLAPERMGGGDNNSMVNK